MALKMTTMEKVEIEAVPMNTAMSELWVRITIPGAVVTHPDGPSTREPDTKANFHLTITELEELRFLLR